ncbi:MAG: DUF5714 domain-containing protein [Chloroflexota bacterium]
MRDGFKVDCLLCGQPLVYSGDLHSVECVVCGGAYEAQVTCQQGHYVCDRCHSISANELIEQICIRSESMHPLELADSLMNSPSIKMHGPEHHFLVPAVLLTAYYNQQQNSREKMKKIRMARQRAEHILGGFCGFYGACGAGIGTGIVVSLITDATPLSTESWGLANRMTAESLRCIGELGGPRCCKRGTYTALHAAKGFLQQNLSIQFDIPDAITCDYSEMNRECTALDCPYRPGHQPSQSLEDAAEQAPPSLKEN